MPLDGSVSSALTPSWTQRGARRRPSLSSARRTLKSAMIAASCNSACRILISIRHVKTHGSRCNSFVHSSTRMDEPISLPIDGVLDLHTFKPHDVKELVADYLEA